MEKIKIVNIMDVYSGMEISTTEVEAGKVVDAAKMFAVDGDIKFAIVDTAYFEHYSSGSVDARISFVGTDEEIWASDVDNGKVHTFVLAKI